MHVARTTVGICQMDIVHRWVCALVDSGRVFSDCILVPALLVQIITFLFYTHDSHDEIMMVRPKRTVQTRDLIFWKFPIEVPLVQNILFLVLKEPLKTIILSFER